MLIFKKLTEEKAVIVALVGKVADIYAQVEISKKIKVINLDALFDATIYEIEHRLKTRLLYLLTSSILTLSTIITGM